MQFLRTLSWVVLAVVAVIFSVRNWTPVTVKLWGGMEADAKLPVLIFGAFLIGLLPTYVLHKATRWSLRRRLDSAERALADARGEPADDVHQPLPTASGPVAVPPALS